MQRQSRSNPLVAGLALLASLFGATSALALADLQITAMNVVGSARVGDCNSVSMTVRNNGDAFTGNATLDIELVTFPSGTPFQNRASTPVIISPMQGGAQVTFTASNVKFLAEGAATLQAVVDSTQETDESNENNNVRTLSTNVSGSCPGAPPPKPRPDRNPSGCDVTATYIQPSGNTAPANQQNYSYQLRFKNQGSRPCNGFKVNLSRYNNKTCSGYGSRIGGSRAWASVPSLAPGQQAVASITERRTPSGGTVCIKPGFSPNSYGDDNNANHRTKKVIKYQ
ncbi:MAG: hypothetical protein MPN21_16855 [Thermoanaerobaculia bacterium]|nr:hypothetical protein [Thermoanaerobaculia bacterium]